MGSVRRSAAQRAELIEAYKASGQSGVAFAAREHIAPSTFYQWLAAASPAKQPVTKTSIRVARMIRHTVTKEPQPATALVIEVGGMRVQVAVGFERTSLEAVLDVLQARVLRGVA